MSSIFAILLLAQITGATSGFPSAPGTVWRYAGTASWTQGNSSEVRSSKVEWQSTVVDSQRSGETTVVVVRGFLRDLAWYEPGKKAQLTVVTFRPDGLYLLRVSDESGVPDLVKGILAGEDAGDQILGSTPRVGDCLGAAPGRNDEMYGMYCWYVERKIRYKHRSGWAVGKRSLPDEKLLEFVPGIGFTAFSYTHHGTVASASVSLVAVESPSK